MVHPLRTHAVAAAVALAVAVAVTMLLAACGAPAPTPPTTPAANTAPAEPADASEPAEFDQALHDELVAMLERDQLDRTGGSSGESDQTRTDRLKQIVDEHGWPTIDLVGEDGEDAAWAIAQHSDLDPAFQAEALELLRAAVAAGRASPGNLAYLEDRVAVGAGEPQRYGTQVGCGPDGPVPATPIDDEAGLEARRAEAGLESYADYLAQMTVVCASTEQ